MLSAHALRDLWFAGLASLQALAAASPTSEVQVLGGYLAAKVKEMRAIAIAKIASAQDILRKTASLASKRADDCLDDTFYLTFSAEQAADLITDVDLAMFSEVTRKDEPPRVLVCCLVSLKQAHWCSTISPRPAMVVATR